MGMCNECDGQGLYAQKLLPERGSDLPKKKCIFCCGLGRWRIELNVVVANIHTKCSYVTPNVLKNAKRNIQPAWKNYDASLWRALYDSYSKYDNKKTQVEFNHGNGVYG